MAVALQRGRRPVTVCRRPRLAAAVAVAAASWLRGLPRAGAAVVPDLEGVPHTKTSLTKPVDQGIQYVWPTVVWSAPLVASTNDTARSDAALFERLASVAEAKFDAYAKEVLQQELQVDATFAEEFQAADDSRTNLAFLRWQKRVFSETMRVPVEEIEWDGKPVPRLKGISYAWPELYKTRDYAILKQKLRARVSSYLRSIGAEVMEKPRIFIWAEVYRSGEAQWPHAHTGAAAAGMFFARFAEGELGGQTLMFEDMRGASPPFGRTYEHNCAEGQVVIWPAWESHYLTPNPANDTNVVLSFLVWPEGGVHDFDWEDDPTGDYVYEKETTVKQQGKQAPVPAQGANAKAPDGKRGEL